MITEDKLAKFQEMLDDLSSRLAVVEERSIDHENRLEDIEEILDDEDD